MNLDLTLRNKIGNTGLYSWLYNDKIPIDCAETARVVLGILKLNNLVSIKDAYCFWKAYSEYKHVLWKMPIETDEVNDAAEQFLRDEIKLLEKK